jgi:hypothetical protein
VKPRPAGDVAENVGLNGDLPGIQWRISWDLLGFWLVIEWEWD